MTTSATPLLLSLKPRYADLVFGGQKTVELRRRSLKRMEGRDVFVYATTPVRTLQGRFKVGKVWDGTPEQIWEIASQGAGVEKSDFDAYFAGRDVAYALEIVDAREFEQPLTLVTLKRMIRDFVVPQSWRYVKPDEHQTLRSIQDRQSPSFQTIDETA